MNRLLYLLKTFFSRLNLLFERNWVESFSQEGEDMLLRKIFENHKPGFYVDIGAHHPKRFSNTYYFYKRSWNGINIDAAPGSMKQFNNARKRDINIEAAVSNQTSELIFYTFDEPALNTLDKDLANERLAEKKHKLIGEVKVITKTLSGILDKHIPPNTEIDFLSVDVEGFDLEVLSSNDWQKYRPRFIVVECFGKGNFEDIISDDTYKFLSGKNYTLYAKTINTCIFKDNQKLN